MMWLGHLGGKDEMDWGDVSGQRAESSEPGHVGEGTRCQRQGSRPSEEASTCSALCRTSEGLAAAPGGGVKMGLWQLEVLVAKQNRGQAGDTDFRNSYMEKIIM